MRKLEFFAPTGGRLSRLLCARGESYAAVCRALRNRDVRLNGEKVSADAFAGAGDLITAFLPNEELSVAYENGELLVTIKPQGLETTGEVSMESRVQAQFPKARACHRLDVNTGGLVIFAKNDAAFARICEDIKRRKIEKYYLCATVRAPEKPQSVLTAYLTKDAKRGKVTVSQRPAPNALQIKTGYRVLASGFPALLEVRLFTGRTHQIRAHMAYIGCPVIGDDKYGDRAQNAAFGLRRQALFAYRLVLSDGTAIQAKPELGEKLNGCFRDLNIFSEVFKTP